MYSTRYSYSASAVVHTSVLLLAEAVATRWGPSPQPFQHFGFGSTSASCRGRCCRVLPPRAHLRSLSVVVFARTTLILSSCA